MSNLLPAKEFNRIRAAFMRRASAPNINPFVLKLAYVIAFKYMGVESQIAYPAQETLAADLNVSDRTIRSLLNILEPLGLVIVTGHGPGKSSTYWIDPDKATRKCPKSGSQLPVIRGSQFPLIEPNTGNSVHDNRKLDDTNTGSQLPPNLTKRTKKKEPRGKKRALRARAKSPDLGDGSQEESARAGNPQMSENADNCLSRKEEGKTAVADGFARFWSSYPRKVNEDDARAAFAKAIAGGADIEAVVARAATYALERAEAISNGDNPKWTPYPATWLKKRKFNEPPPGAPVIDQAGNVVAFAPESQPQLPARRSNRQQTWSEVQAEVLELLGVSDGN